MRALAVNVDNPIARKLRLAVVCHPHRAIIAATEVWFGCLRVAMLRRVADAGDTALGIHRQQQSCGNNPPHAVEVYR
jgi:hypothetical protein